MSLGNANAPGPASEDEAERDLAKTNSRPLNSVERSDRDDFLRMLNSAPPADDEPVVASFGVIGRRYDAAGVPRGPELIVSGEFNYFEVGTAIAGRDLAGVWERLESSDHNVWLHRVDAGGTGRGPAPRVNTFTTGRQSAPWGGMRGSSLDRPP